MARKIIYFNVVWDYPELSWMCCGAMSGVGANNLWGPRPHRFLPVGAIAPLAVQSWQPWGDAIILRARERSKQNIFVCTPTVDILGRGTFVANDAENRISIQMLAVANAILLYPEGFKSGGQTDKPIVCAPHACRPLVELKQHSHTVRRSDQWVQVELEAYGHSIECITHASLSGVTPQRHGAERLSRRDIFCTFWPCDLDLRPFDLLFIGERGIVIDRLSLRQVWWFCFKPFWFYRADRQTNR